MHNVDYTYDSVPPNPYARVRTPRVRLEDVARRDAQALAARLRLVRS